MDRINQADYFFIRDDRLINKMQRVPAIETRVISPIALAIEVLP